LVDVGWIMCLAPSWHGRLARAVPRGGRLREHHGRDAGVVPRGGRLREHHGRDAGVVPRGGRLREHHGRDARAVTRGDRLREHHGRDARVVNSGSPLREHHGRDARATLSADWYWNSTFFASLIGAVVVLLALRAVDEDPFGAWWSVAAIVAISALAGA